MRVLVTGGAGYIGSHTMLNLLAEGNVPLVVDDFSNSSPRALDRVARLSNRNFEHIDADISDRNLINQIMDDFKPQAVIHFAGLKSVGDSQKLPLTYYEQNVSSAIHLLKSMDRVGCKQIIFSSSATVYGRPHYLPCDEEHPVAPVNVYGRTKYFIEEIIRDWAAHDPNKSAAILRYFNPVGAHSSGLIGENPTGIPNNLVPFIAQVAVGKREKLHVFGNDYDTPDGTGVRDYIHVSDLATGHIAALNYISAHTGIETINLGCGKGFSVMQVINSFRLASGQNIPYEIRSRRDGDVGELYANSEKAKSLLNWEANLSLDQMCQDVWRWQSQNPKGFEE